MDGLAGRAKRSHLAVAGRLCSSIRQTSLETLLGAIGQSWLGVGSTEMAFIQENDIVCTEEAKINERSCYWEEGRGESTSIACARLRSCITGNHIYCLSIRRPFSGGNYLAPVSLPGVKIAGPGAGRGVPSLFGSSDGNHFDYFGRCDTVAADRSVFLT